jgi:hypothetical protein
LVGYLGPFDPALNTAPMVMNRKAVAGALIGGIAETQEMLDFCCLHGITSNLGMIDIQEINAAYERMLRRDVKYRFVIDMASPTTAMTHLAISEQQEGKAVTWMEKVRRRTVRQVNPADHDAGFEQPILWRTSLPRTR